MNRALVIFYAVAVAFHTVVLFYLKPPAPKPPKIFNETYVDVTLTTPPPETPKPIVVPPLKPKVEMPLPKPEEKPQPAPSPKPEMTIPEPKPQPTPQPSAPKPVVVPPPQPKSPEKYVSITEPKYARRVQAIYPGEAQRRHQQGSVTVMIYINESGVLDKVEIVKSSGYPLLDAAAVKAVKQSEFSAQLVDAIQVGSRAEQTFTFELTR
jgi:periplasmic protein TonB